MKTAIEHYVRAYRQNPETKEEIDAAHRAAGAILSGESWYYLDTRSAGLLNCGISHELPSKK